MQEKRAYAYNSGTKALHITGFCKDAFGNHYFDSEGEAIRFAGRQIFFCTICARKRDELVREKVKQIKGAKEK